MLFDDQKVCVGDFSGATHANQATYGQELYHERRLLAQKSTHSERRSSCSRCRRARDPSKEWRITIENIQRREEAKLRCYAELLAGSLEKIKKAYPLDDRSPTRARFRCCRRRHRSGCFCCLQQLAGARACVSRQSTGIKSAVAAAAFAIAMFAAFATTFDRRCCSSCVIVFRADASPPLACCCECGRR